MVATWRVGGFSKQIISRVISTLNGIRVRVMVLITPENNYLVSPPTLQVGGGWNSDVEQETNNDVLGPGKEIISFVRQTRGRLAEECAGFLQEIFQALGL